MPKALWRGAISFSLVHIPVGLYPATRARHLDLDLLDRHDFAPVGYQRINKKSGKVVDWKDIVKGYEYRKGEYVVLSDEDFKRANVKATQTVEIESFVERSAIEPWYFDTPYYLLPEKKAGKAYGLLHSALVESGMLGVASVVIRTRQSTAVLVPVGDLIVLNTLRYAFEIVDATELARDVPTSAPRPREKQMALQLIEQMSTPWKPGSFHDTYREDLLKRVKERVKAGTTHAAASAAPAGAKARPKGDNVIDIVALLQRSLGDRKPGARPPPQSPPAPRARTGARTRAAPRRKASQVGRV
jgi:DNA end-binding protein Ku